MRIEYCPCGKSVKWLGNGSVGDFINQTGWDVAPTFTGSIVNLCPECGEKARILALELANIVGSGYVSVSNLLPKDFDFKE